MGLPRREEFASLTGIWMGGSSGTAQKITQKKPCVKTRARKSNLRSQEEGKKGA